MQWIDCLFIPSILDTCKEEIVLLFGPGFLYNTRCISWVWVSLVLCFHQPCRIALPFLFSWLLWFLGTKSPAPPNFLLLLAIPVSQNSVPFCVSHNSFLFFVFLRIPFHFSCSEFHSILCFSEFSSSFVFLRIQFCFVFCFTHWFWSLYETYRSEFYKFHNLSSCHCWFPVFIEWNFRLEEVRIGERHGQAKILGVLLCVLGAMALLFYKGPNLLPRMGLTNATLPQRAPPLSGEVFAELLQQWGISKWQIGALCIIGSSLSLAVYINLQVCFLSLAWVSECNPICSRGYKFESILSTLDMLQQNYVNKNHII